MTMIPYPMGGSTRTSVKLIMEFKGKDLEYWVEDYLIAVTANLTLT